MKKLFRLFNQLLLVSLAVLGYSCGANDNEKLNDESSNLPVEIEADFKEINVKNLQEPLKGLVLKSDKNLMPCVNSDGDLVVFAGKFADYYKGQKTSEQYLVNEISKLGYSTTISKTDLKNKDFTNTSGDKYEAERHLIKEDGSLVTLRTFGIGSTDQIKISIITGTTSLLTIEDRKNIVDSMILSISELIPDQNGLDTLAESCSACNLQDWNLLRVINNKLSYTGSKPGAGILKFYQLIQDKGYFFFQKVIERVDAGVLDYQNGLFEKGYEKGQIFLINLEGPKIVAYQPYTAENDQSYALSANSSNKQTAEYQLNVNLKGEISRTIEQVKKKMVGLK